MSGSVVMIEVGGRGGVTDYTQALVGALDAQGHRVELVTARDHLYRLPPSVHVHPWVPWVRDRAPLGRLIRRAGLGSSFNALCFVLVLPGIVRLARSATVVHLQGSYFPPLSALLGCALRVTGTPLVLTQHNTFDRGRSHGWAHRLLARCARTTIVHTESDRRRLAERGEHRVAVIPHGEYGGLARTGGQADRETARRSIGVIDGEIVALLFGQLRPDKGVGEFLAAATEVEKLRPAVAGEDIGGLAAASQAVAQLGDRLIVEEGFLPMSTAARLFAAADVAVLPYRMASQSGVLLLAYGFERPVVAYPVGGLTEAVVEGETGWLCRDATPEALAETLRAVVSAGPEECARRGAAGRRLSETRYSWDAIARSTRGVYAAAAAA